MILGVPTAQAVGAVPRSAALKQKGEFDQQRNSSCASSSSSSSSLPPSSSSHILSYLSHLASESLSLSLVSVRLHWSPVILSLSLSLLSPLPRYLSGTPFSSPDWKSTQFAQTAVSLLFHIPHNANATHSISSSYCFALSLLLFTALIGNYSFFLFLFLFLVLFLAL